MKNVFYKLYSSGEIKLNLTYLQSMKDIYGKYFIYFIYNSLNITYLYLYNIYIL